MDSEQTKKMSMKCKNLTYQQAVVIVIIFVLALLACVFFSSCATARLAARLAPEFRGWYSAHVILMHTDVPEFVSGQKGMTEQVYFLRLPYDQQVKYQQMFWKMRDFDTEAIFKSRVAYIERFWPTERRTPMADLILLCGLPEDVLLYTPEGDLLGPAGIFDNSGNSQVVAYWYYYYQNYPVVYGFECRGQTWHPYPVSAEMGLEQLKFEQYWSWLMGPSWNGWDLWVEEMKK